MCEWCGVSFTSGARGPVAKYCRGSHRQRAYEARRLAQMNGSAASGSTDLRQALDQLAAAVAASGPLETAARDVLDAAGVTALEQGPVGGDAATPNRVRLVGPWKVTLDTGAGPQAWTSHRSEPAAEKMRDTLSSAWKHQQLPATVTGAQWQVTRDLENELGPGFGAEEAQRQAVRLVIDAAAAVGVTYRYQVAPIALTSRQRHQVTRHSDGFAEDLGKRWGHWGPAKVYEIDPLADSAVRRHWYVHDLVADALGLFERHEQRPNRTALTDATGEFTSQVIEPLGSSWVLAGETIRDWFLAAGLVEEGNR